MFDAIVGIANIVGAIAGVVGAFAAMAALPRGRKRKATVALSRGSAPEEAVNRHPSEEHITEPVKSGISGAITFLILEESRRAKAIFWGDNLSDEGVYQHFKMCLMMSMVLFISAFFGGYTVLTNAANGLSGVLGVISAVQICLGIAVCCWAYARFRRRFGP